jgi:SpoVK/Ycf46/Vps4 family AAA+-type ATPase
MHVLTMTENRDLDRDYLSAVLVRLDVCLEREVRRWQAAGQNPADRFRGLHISDQEALSLTKRGVGSHWGSDVLLPGNEEQRLEDLINRALDKVKKIEQMAEAAQKSLRLKQLAELFGLSPFEWWSFIVCLAPALDLRYERIYGYLQDDVTRLFPSVDLMLALLAEGEPMARLDHLQDFEPYSPLRLYRLLIPVDDSGKKMNNLRQGFQVAPGVVEWLMGAYSASGSLGDWGELFLPPESDEQSSEAAEVFEQDKIPSPDVLTSVKPFLSFYGSDLLQQELAARQISAGLGKPLLRIKFTVGEPIETALEKLFQAVRDARMLEAQLYLQGSDIFVNEDGCLLPACFEALRLVDDGILFSSRSAFKLSPDMPGNDYPLMHVPFQDLATRERMDLWKALLDDTADDVKEIEWNTLAGQFSLTSGQIVAAASTAMAQALQEERALTSDDLLQAARFHSGHHLAELAHKIEPRYVWEDLVLPETPLNMLQEMVNMVKARSLVLDQWGLGRKLTSSTGISALFSGPPGTGKTLAAQIMANQLGIDLYRIDLSTVVSKYIGETEKNLERIFSDAAQSNAILFFDEADTIFGKRSEVKDAHDRYANIEVGYLLQRMESYSGVSILATNLRANLDEAFTRRLQFIVNFPFPDEEYRLKIWEVLMPPDMPHGSNLDLKLMADRFKLSGGSIRNIIVSAAFLAASDGGQVEMTHLLHGARRELQKIGKLLNENDFAYGGNGADHV